MILGAKQPLFDEIVHPVTLDLSRVLPEKTSGHCGGRATAICQNGNGEPNLDGCS